MPRTSIGVGATAGCPHDAHRAMRARKGRLCLRCVAIVKFEAHVAWNVVVQRRRALLQRSAEADDDGQSFVIDLDKVGGIARGAGGLGHNKRDLLADETHAVTRQHRTLGHQQLLPTAAGRRLDRRQRRERPVRHFLSGEHGDDARLRPRRRHIDRADQRMRTFGPAECGVRLAIEIPVIGVTPRASDEAKVLAAAFETIRHLRAHMPGAARGFGGTAAAASRRLGAQWLGGKRNHRPGGNSVALRRTVP